MKPAFLKLAAACLFIFFTLGVVCPRSAHALDAGDLISFFISELSPYGRWVDTRYGQSWEPYNQGSDWRPYSRGHWVYSDRYGWVWEAAEEWGAIPYHYGRWGYVDNRWVWVPDRTWGPAWVDWRSNNEYVGWAPLPPDADWEGDNEWRPRHSYVSTPTAYVFVPQRSFGSSHIVNYFVSREQVPVILERTQNITIYRTVEGRVRNEGPRREVIEQATGRRITSAVYVPRSIHGKELPAPPERHYVRHQERDKQQDKRVSHPSQKAATQNKAAPQAVRAAPSPSSQGSKDAKSKHAAHEKRAEPAKPGGSSNKHETADKAAVQAKADSGNPKKDALDNKDEKDQKGQKDKKGHKAPDEQKSPNKAKK